VEVTVTVGREKLRERVRQHLLRSKMHRVSEASKEKRGRSCTPQRKSWLRLRLFIEAFPPGASNKHLFKFIVMS
jgi:hypothetical protein